MAPQTDGETTIDYYELLGITATASESEVRRAYRKTSLLYHPDKVKPTPENLDKFQLLQTAYNTLTDPAEKTKYDQTREAKLRRLAETAALEGRRRQMKEELEKREGAAPVSVNGTKRSWSQRDLDIKRIAEENRRKREAATVQKAKDTQARVQAEEKSTDSIDRSIKIRWIKEGDGLDIDQSVLEDSFPAGDVENVLMLKDKKRKIDGREKKVVCGTAVIVFTTLLAAKRAVTKGPWEGIESVAWAAEKESEPT